MDRAKRLVVIVRSPEIERLIREYLQRGADELVARGQGHPEYRALYLAAANAIRNPAAFDQDDTGWLTDPIPEVIEG